MTGMHPRTTVRDAVLADLSEGLDDAAVQGVEWAAVEATVAAVRDRQPKLINWETYRDAEIAL